MQLLTSPYWLTVFVWGVIFSILSLFLFAVTPRGTISGGHYSAGRKWLASVYLLTTIVVLCNIFLNPMPDDPISLGSLLLFSANIQLFGAVQSFGSVIPLRKNETRVLWINLAVISLGAIVCFLFANSLEDYVLKIIHYFSLVSYYLTTTYIIASFACGIGWRVDRSSRLASGPSMNRSSGRTSQQIISPFSETTTKRNISLSSGPPSGYSTSRCYSQACEHNASGSPVGTCRQGRIQSFEPNYKLSVACSTDHNAKQEIVRSPETILECQWEQSVFKDSATTSKATGSKSVGHRPKQNKKIWRLFIFSVLPPAIVPIFLGEPKWLHMIFLSVNSLTSIYYTIQYINYSNTAAEPEASIRFGGDKDDLIGSRIEMWIKQKKYLEENLTLEIVSARLGTNKSYLSRYVNEVIGLDFKSWIKSLRIEQARQMIESGSGMSLIEIAELCGIPNRNTFTKQFTEIVGQTPAEYRKNFRLE